MAERGACPSLSERARARERGARCPDRCLSWRRGRHPLPRPAALKVSVGRLATGRGRRLSCGRRRQAKEACRTSWPLGTGAGLSYPQRRPLVWMTASGAGTRAANSPRRLPIIAPGGASGWGSCASRHTSSRSRPGRDALTSAFAKPSGPTSQRGMPTCTQCALREVCRCAQVPRPRRNPTRRAAHRSPRLLRGRIKAPTRGLVGQPLREVSSGSAITRRPAGQRCQRRRWVWGSASSGSTVDSKSSRPEVS